jgi:glycerophosphoryl diester phosphodiesterase
MIPHLAAKCAQPFRPYDPRTGTAAVAQCCTSDITLAEFKQLCGKMDGANPKAVSRLEYVSEAATPGFRTNLYAGCARVLTHDESIDLIQGLGRNFAPELKAYQPNMRGGAEGEGEGEGGQGRTAALTYDQVRDKLIAAYVRRNISAHRVYPQSFNRQVEKCWRGARTHAACDHSRWCGVHI